MDNDISDIPTPPLNNPANDSLIEDAVLEVVPEVTIRPCLAAHLDRIRSLLDDMQSDLNSLNDHVTDLEKGYRFPGTVSLILSFYFEIFTVSNVNHQFSFSDSSE